MADPGEGGGPLARNVTASQARCGQDAHPEHGGERRQRLYPGPVLASAVRVARREWWRILAVSVPVSVADTGLEIVVSRFTDPSDLALSLGATLSATGFSVLGTVLVAGFITRLVGAAGHGQERLTLWRVARSLLWWRLIAADILVSVLVVAGTVLLILPGVVALTFLAVVGPVIEIEHRKTLAALARSARLVRGHFWLTVLLAVLPQIAAALLVAVAPDPHRAGQIALFLAIRGVAEGVAEACIGVILVELCFRLMDASRVRAGSRAGR